MKRIALVVAAVALSSGCQSKRVDPVFEFASASCAAVQNWVDAVEDEAKELSDVVTHLDTVAARWPYYGIYARALHERADDTVRQLRHIAPPFGDGRDAADVFITAIQNSERVASELIATADAFPKQSDTEDVYSRMSLMLVGNEKAFSYATTARTQLAERYPAFATTRSCIDYADPVT